MPCAAGELCTLPGFTPEPPNGSVCRGVCGGRHHGVCGDVEDSDGANSMHRICPACVDAKLFSKDTTTACGKRWTTDKEGRGARSSKSARSGAGKKDESAPRARLSLLLKSLRSFQLVDQGVSHSAIAGRYTWRSRYGRFPVSRRRGMTSRRRPSQLQAEAAPRPTVAYSRRRCKETSQHSTAI